MWYNEIDSLTHEDESEDHIHMKLEFLGGAMEIGGSSIYIRAAGKGFLLDSGIRQSAGKDPLPDFRTIQAQGGLDAIIISHAHMDHIGTLPIISKAYPQAPIYMTAMTADLVRVLLFDSLKIMDRREDEIPHYAEKDVVSMLNRIITRGFNTPVSLCEDCSLTFYPAGHIAGAACCYLVTEDGSLFYSGDFSAFSQMTIEGIRIPRLRPDVTIMETTYGTQLHANRQAEEHRLVSLVKECAERGGKILIPAFALGRAQEVQLILRGAIQNGEIPKVPVYVDGMVRDINTMYVRNPTYLKNSLARRVLKGNEPFYTEEIQPVSRAQNREELLKQKGPAVFISSSGMLTGGPSVEYAKGIAAMEEGCIILTGYQDEESPGRQLIELLEQPEGRKLTLDNTSVPVKCRIERVGLSAHGDQSEITSLLDHLSSRHVFLVHGDKAVIEELGNELAGDYKRKVYLPVCGETVDLALMKKRKQMSAALPALMGRERPFTKTDEKELWDFWQSAYRGKALPVSQAAWIWYGRPVEDENVLQDMQAVLQDSVYFSPNARRLYLYEATPAEAVEAALAPRELTVQEIEEEIRGCFPDAPYKKISYRPQSREVFLVFDFPDGQDRETFEERAEEFQKKTGWKVGISPSMNFNAADGLLASLFGDRLAKTSHYEIKKQYSIVLSAADGKEQELAEEFCRATAWSLEIKGEPGAGWGGIMAPGMTGKAAAQGTTGKAVSLGIAGGAAAPGTLGGCGDNGEGWENSEKDWDGFFRPEGSVKPLEQNNALFCIDQSFEGRQPAPYRKSIKQDGEGRYMELVFISPMAGCRCRELLQAIASEIGWRIRIADSVNQNELFKLAKVLCDRHGVALAKAPSYLPLKRAVQLKIREGGSREGIEAVCREFFELTGCACGESL